MAASKVSVFAVYNWLLTATTCHIALHKLICAWHTCIFLHAYLLSMATLHVTSATLQDNKKGLVCDYV